MKNAFPRWLAAILVVGIVALLAGNAWFYITQKRQLQRTAIDQLQAISRSKVDQITAWRSGQLANASVLMRNTTFIESVAHWMADPRRGNEDVIWSVLSASMEQYGYQDVLLAAPDGKVLISLNSRSEPVREAVRRAMDASIRNREAVIADLHDGPHEGIHLDVVAPLFRVGREAADPVAAVVFRIDPRQFLFPLIQSWPIPSDTAETLLVRRDGDNVLYLNELRHQTDPALSLRFPLSREKLPAAMALAGRAGVVEGVDYRGKEVIAFLSSIPESPWVMVAKVDKEEAFEMSRFVSVLGSIVFLVLVAALAAAIGIVWQRNAKAQYRALFRAEEMRRKAEERHRITLMSVGDGVVATDADGRVELLNPVAAGLTGWSQEEAQGRGLEEIFRIVNEETRKEVENPVRIVMREGLVVGLANHTILIARDGTERPIADSGAPIRNEKGDIAGVVLVFRDQSEERAVERALSESEQRYRHLFQHMQEGFSYCRMVFEDGKPADFLYVSVNDAFEALTGLRGVEGKKASEVIPGIRESNPELIEIYGRVAQGGSPEKFETFVEPLEDWFSVSVYCPEKGYFVSVFDVITDRKRAEEEREKLEAQLRQSQKMEAVGTLAGGIAHDFNNALTGVIGFGELLRLRIGGNDQANHDLDEIMRCAERASGLTRQLLAYARRQVIAPMNLNLNDLVRDLYRLVGKIGGEHVEVTTPLAKDVPIVCVDRGQIEQVIMNLCMNARDAMPAGGRLVIETRSADVDAEHIRRFPYMKAGKYAVLSVSDTGTGMDESIRERIYEPFFTTKGPDKGTGLGLAVVYGIVKQHGGFIHLYSEKGKGTSFHVYFPAVEGEADPVPRKHEEEAVRGGRETILVAEDEDAIRGIAERVLRDLGYNVLSARNGEEAIEKFNGNQVIDLAVLDLMMPRKGGREAFEEMRKARPGLKVVFMSGYSADAVDESFMLGAGLQFLQKPFTPSTLAKKIREVLNP